MSPRVGLVLGGGGLTGTAFHAGVLAGLADVGWDPRSAAIAVGTSAGSTSAALLRAGLPGPDFVARMTGRAPSSEGRAVLAGLGPMSQPQQVGRRSLRPGSPQLLAAMARRPWAFRPQHLAAGLLPEGTVEAMGTVSSLGSVFGTWPARPTWITAVRLDTGARVVFGRDATAPLRDAISASCAIPGYFAPVVIDGVRHVDGGVWSMNNADLLRDAEVDVVIVSAPLATADRLHLSRDNAVRVPLRLALDREVAGLRSSGKRVIVIAPDQRLRSVMGSSTMDLARRAPVAQAATAHLHRLARAGELADLLGAG